ncbi:response regulator [Nocardia acidivorans]|uniref:response regulator n=1 Tax=Nocardia acidivorans TaxID=404580 RepID=UPI0035A260EA
MGFRRDLLHDHPPGRRAGIFAAGLLGLLVLAEAFAPAAESDLQVVGEADSGAEAVELVEQLRPDVVLMDLRMPGMDGVRATEAILTRRPVTKVVVVTTYETDSDILRAVEAGASGYLLKDTSRAELATAVRSAVRGATVLAPSVAGRLLRHTRRPNPISLSSREVDVLKCVARGMTNAAIGQQLHITEATVKTHLLRAFAKLEVSDRTAAVTTAMTHGLLDD